MTRFEILGFLTSLRCNGNNNYYTYMQIHKRLLAHGMTHSERSTYRIVNTLWTDGLLEARTQGDILFREVLFRAKMPKNVDTLQVRRVHNTNRELVENRGATTQRRALR